MKTSLPLLLFSVLAVSSLAPPALAGDARLPAAPEQIRPMLLGTQVPDVPLQTLQGADTTLAAQLEGKPAILVFYRGGWCPYCNMQLSDLRLIREEAAALGYRMIAVSPDRPQALTRTMDATPLEYTLLSDSSAAAMRAFGIAFRVDDATLEKYREYGIDLEAASGETHHALPVPSVFVIDAEGVLQFSYVHPDYRLRVPGDVILAAAKAIAERRQHVKPKA